MKLKILTLSLLSTFIAMDIDAAEQALTTPQRIALKRREAAAQKLREAAVASSTVAPTALKELAAPVQPTDLTKKPLSPLDSTKGVQKELFGKPNSDKIDVANDLDLLASGLGEVGAPKIPEVAKEKEAAAKAREEAEAKAKEAAAAKEKEAAVAKEKEAAVAREKEAAAAKIEAAKLNAETERKAKELEAAKAAEARLAEVAKDSAASAKALKEVREEVARLTEELADTNRKLAEVEQVRDVLSAELKLAQEKIASDFKAHQISDEEVTKNKLALEESLMNLEAAKASVKSKQTEISDLVRQIEDLKIAHADELSLADQEKVKRLEAQREALIDEASAQMQALRTELEAAMKKATEEYEAAIAGKEKAIQEVQLTRQGQQVAVQALEAEKDTYAGLNRKANEKLDEAIRQLEDSNSRLEETRTQLEAANLQLIEFKDLNAKLVQKLKQKQIEKEGFETQIQKAEESLSSAALEKVTLQGRIRQLEEAAAAVPQHIEEVRKEASKPVTELREQLQLAARLEENLRAAAEQAANEAKAREESLRAQFKLELEQSKKVAAVHLRDTILSIMAPFSELVGGDKPKTMSDLVTLLSDVEFTSNAVKKAVEFPAEFLEQIDDLDKAAE